MLSCQPLFRSESSLGEEAKGGNGGIFLKKSNKLTLKEFISTCQASKKNGVAFIVGNKLYYCLGIACDNHITPQQLSRYSCSCEV